MKTNKFLIIMALVAGTFLYASCNGGSVKNNYNAPSNIDTGRVTTTTGDASTIDNGGSGGTEIAKPKSTDTSNTMHMTQKDSVNK